MMKRLIFFIVLGFISLATLATRSSNSNQKSNTSYEAVSATSTPLANTETEEAKVLGEADEPKITPTPTRTIYIGMWTEGFWDDTLKTLHPEKLLNIEKMLGKKMAIAHYYRGWHYLADKALIQELLTINSHGWRPMISANPYFFDGCVSTGSPIYKTIASGNCDDFMQTVGRNLREYGKSIFLRFAWEINIPSIEWGIQKVGDTPADFIAAWKRFHDILWQEQATNALWVFSPNTVTPDSIPYSEIYPGDSYVDWLGLDGYNWGTTQSWSTWQTFSQVFFASYSQITNLAPSKPVMIAEVNTTDQGGDKASWYEDMLEDQLTRNFPRVKAIVFYNENRHQEHVNWLIDVSPKTIEALRSSLQNNVYSSSF